MALTAEELKIIKMLQNNPELLARVQDENAFTQAVAETRIDRNHRFILGAIDARERTNWTEDERNNQDVFIQDVCDLMDSLVSMVQDRFKVKSNEKGEAWHALSYLTESGATFSFKMDTKFSHTPDKNWEYAYKPETVEVPEAPKPAKK